MESRWYYFSGQNAENTKISERAHVLNITTSAWNQITEHLDRKKRIQDAIEKEQTYKKSLKQGSESMTKQWGNSIENLRLKKEKEKQEQIDQKKDDKIQLFYKLREDQENLRKEYIKKVKKDVYRSSGYPRELTSALILSETLHELNQQKAFNDKLKKRKKESEDKFAIEAAVSDAKYQQELKVDKQKQMQKKKEIALILKSQITERQTIRQTNDRLRIERETQDRVNAAKEDELLKQLEIDKKIKRKQQFKEENKKELEAQIIRKHVLKKEETEFEKAAELYNETKRKINCLIKEKENQMRYDSIKSREILAAKVGHIQKTREALEDETIAKVIEERELIAKAKIAAEKVAKEEAAKARNEDRHQYLERKKKEDLLENKIKQWELLNRCKTDKVTCEYNKEKRQEKWLKVLKYQKELLEQMEEKKQIEKQEKKINLVLSQANFDQDDKMFFDYAKEIIDLAKSKGRSTYPIDKIITEYKKIHSLQEKTTSCKCNKT